MTLQIKFILFAVVVHSLLAASAYLLLQESPYLFIGMEVLVLVSVVITAQLYQAFFKPLRILRSGIESIRDKDFSTKFAPVGQRELDDLVSVYNRMIDQLRQERITQAEKHFLLEKLTQASPAGIILLGFDNYVEAVNPAAERFLQVQKQELLQKHLHELPKAWATELASIKDGEAKTFRIDGIRIFRCHRGHFIDRGFQHAFVLMEELTEAMVKNERQAYEKIIRMMSHEINNSTGAINSILDSIKYYAPQLAPEDQPDFENALQVAIDRNKNLSRFMSNFADVVRLPQPTKITTDVHAIVYRLSRLMQQEFNRRHICYTFTPAGSPLLVSLDEQQIEQALINILKNAAEAIGNEGEIHIRTETSPPRITITDNGGGIPEHIRPLLFTPFFSTKETGQGIGLTMIREILLNHGFTFSLTSDEAGITAFIINLSSY
ncbi:PAS domain-containing sensor histidine kinase [Pontibacter sp. SGAir0037]|uniref:sensor histidine kinase n=1 Tax=Pontibacter sp. SGAir0037 TaxID=2571030 RepID=UPI0010CD04D8|nr:ATP-binding protein [Pontibacter sp. SGAir0037]QCR22809.1 histidine kinase [Pontibacter sp. SGAir0037]